MTALLGPFRLVPGIVWAGLIALLVAMLGVQTLRVSQLQTDIASEQRDRADERARLTAQALTAEQQARAEGQRRVDEQQEVIRGTEAQLSAARDAAGRLPDLDRRVRDATRALAACRSRPADDPAATEGGEAPDQTAGVLAELQRVAQAAEAARTRYADEAGIAAERCSASYDALTPAWPTRLPSQP